MQLSRAALLSSDGTTYQGACSKRLCCSSTPTENQYLSTTIPDLTSIRSNSGQLRRNSWCSWSVQNPITHSTFERLYELRSNSTISPAAGRCST